MNDLERKVRAEVIFKPFLDEFNLYGFKEVYFSCSGGWDSTYMLLNLYDLIDAPKKFILFNNTTLNKKECKETLYKLSEITGLKVIELKPTCNVRKILKESFLRLNEAKKLLKENRYHKKVFRCCYYLKEKPLIEFCKKLGKDAVVLTGIKKSDSRQRRIFLFKITKDYTYFNFSKRYGVYFGYPLRDTKEKQVESFISKLPYKVYHSGCQVCPILLLFNLTKEGDRYAFSRNYYFQLTGRKWCVTIEDFLKDKNNGVETGMFE